MQNSSKSGIRFRERSDLLDFLLEASATTSETIDLDRLLANVAEIVRRVIPAELFAILLHSEKRKALRIRYAIGHREEVVRKLIIPVGEGIIGAAAAAGEPVLVNDVRKDTRYLHGMDAVRSELAVPMMVRGRLVGVIDVQSVRPDVYGQYERSLLRLIGSRVAAAIDNARLHRRLQRKNRTLLTLTRLFQEFSFILDLDALLQKIADTIRELVNYDAFSVLLIDEDRKLLRHRFSLRSDERTRLDNVPLGMGITGAAAVSLETIRVSDTQVDPRYIVSHSDMRAEIAVPLIAHGRVIGILDLESERIGNFTDEHTRMLSLLAPQIASSVENARLYEELARREKRMKEDLTAARELQSLLLPEEAPNLEGLEIGLGLRPAHEISGDIYDFFEHDDKQEALIAFGDVSGKGAAAALYGALVSGLLRTLARRHHTPAQLMAALNDALLTRRVEAQYVTLLLMLWDAQGHQFVMANAGSLPPMICREGKILNPRVEGIPLGLLDDREYEDLTFPVQRGDVILLHSDGIMDQLNPAGEEYGKMRLTQLLRSEWKKPTQSIVHAIFADLDSFADGAAAFDDQTLAVLRVT